MATFTHEQLAAIQARGKTIVSASAGSGKKTVMIEKIIRLIKSGVDVSEILAVTYTNKAAAQMKEKLKKELIKSINTGEGGLKERARLKKQLSEVSGADISTIHSFCSNLIRAHFFTAGVDSGFSVIMEDDAEGKALKNKALDLLFEEAYESEEPDFSLLLSVFFRNKKDNELRKLLDGLYTKLRNRADYISFIEKRKTAYTPENFEKISERLFAFAQEKSRYYLSKLAEEKEYFLSCDGEQTQKNGKPRASLALCESIEKFLTEVIYAKDYFSASLIDRPVFPSKERARAEDSLERRKRVERLAFLKSRVEGIYKEDLRIREKNEELDAFLRSGEIAVALGKYLLLLDEKYGELKRAKGVLDCADLEHYTLKLLAEPHIREEVRAKYHYVFIDEYQDVNPVQEQILSAVSGEEVFMVGDVKQSIYGFRGSKSKFFMEKQEVFQKDERSNALFLSNNFRSSDAVLQAVNEQFSLAMTPKNDSVDYAHGSVMQRGGLYAPDSGRVRLYFSALEEETEEAPPVRTVYSVKANAGKKQKKASASARLIKRIIDGERRSKFFDAERGEYRLVEYSDIAILSRKKKGRISEVVDALTAEGVPVSAAASVNICQYPEIKTLIDILSLIDNQEQDIPLCSALLAIGEITADELAEIRLFGENKSVPFRRLAEKYRDENTDFIAYKLKKFYAYFQNLKRYATVSDVGSVLAKIIAETKLEASLLAKENGAGCLKRMHRFLEEATGNEPLSVREFLERLKDLDYSVEYCENGGENAVRVLTMHASKGLEYPIVIVDNLSENFRGGDRLSVFIEDTFGLAPKAYNVENATYADTLLRRLCEIEKERAELADELNLYYVALTRAKYGLHVIFEKPLPLPDVRYAKSFADFTDFSVWEKYRVEEKIPELPYQERTIAVQPEEEKTRKFERALDWQYRYAGYENLPVKRTATDLLETGVAFARRGAGENATLNGVELDFGGVASSTAEEIEREEQTSSYSQKESKEEKIKTGVAYHAFLEEFDFSCLLDGAGTRISDVLLAERVGKAYEKFIKSKRLTDDENALLKQDKLVEILSNSVFSTLNGATLLREQQFIANLSVQEVLSLVDGVEKGEEGSDEFILFQGAIDLLAVQKDGARVIDYKYSSQSAEYLKEHYALQLALYRKVVAKILKLPQEKVRATIVNIRRGFEVELF